MGGIKKKWRSNIYYCSKHFHYFMPLLLHFHNFAQKSEVFLVRISLGNVSVVTC